MHELRRSSTIRHQHQRDALVEPVRTTRRRCSLARLVGLVVALVVPSSVSRRLAASNGWPHNRRLGRPLSPTPIKMGDDTSGESCPRPRPRPHGSHRHPPTAGRLRYWATNGAGLGRRINQQAQQPNESSGEIYTYLMRCNHINGREDR